MSLCVWSLRRENGSGVCLDLQVIDNVPGAKIEEELETHHVLAGNLYKPRRRVQILPHTHPSLSLWIALVHYIASVKWVTICMMCLLLLTSRSLFLQYQSHYSRHFMTVGEKERQDREVFQRNMRNRLESFKSTRYKRHKKDRSQKKARAQNCCKTHLCRVRWTWGRPR